MLHGQELKASPSFEFLNRYDHEFIPTLHARAVPGGPVERAAYDEFKRAFLDLLKAAGPLDGVYLAMHGAMFVDGMQDCEGDWIAATRQVVGDSVPISASYDLHGNLSRRIFDNLDMLSAYRTAPHIDVEETGIRACDILIHCLQHQVRPHLAWCPVPVLMPGERSSTVDQPAKRLYGQLEQMDKALGVLDASLLVGYVWADEPRSTASVVLTGTDKKVLEEQAACLAQQYWDAREEFNFGGVRTGTIRECLDWTEATNTQPVILADSGDNPTGGGVGDRAEVLARLLERSFRNALVAAIADAPATQACHAAGEGAELILTIGASLDPLGSQPVTAAAKVIRLEGEEAVVQIDGVTVILTAKRRPFHFIEDFTRLGLHLESFKLVVVKSGYLSPELAPLANPNLMALSDGCINQDIEGLPSNQFRPPTFPFVRNLVWKPEVFLK